MGNNPRVYINATEAGMLGLPLRYGDTVGDKRFANYKMSKRTGTISIQFLVYKASPVAKNTKRRIAKLKRRRLRSFTNRVKTLFGCRICGYKKNPAALHFHHKNPAEKTTDVSKLIKRSWVKLKEEIRKCEVLCANCHAEVTSKESHHLYEKDK